MTKGDAKKLMERAEGIVEWAMTGVVISLGALGAGIVALGAVTHLAGSLGESSAVGSRLVGCIVMGIDVRVGWIVGRDLTSAARRRVLSIWTGVVGVAAVLVLPTVPMGRLVIAVGVGAVTLAHLVRWAWEHRPPV